MSTPPVVDPGGMGYEITELFVFLVDHGDGDESIMAAQTGDGWMPLITSDRQFAEERMRPVAEQIVGATGKRAKFVRFSTREEIEEYTSE